MEKTILLLISLTSLLCLVVCDPILFDDADDEVGFLPSGGRELFEAMFRRRNALSQRGGAEDRRADRFSDDDEGKGEIGRSSEVSGYEWSPWRRIVAKILSEGDERNDKQVS